MNDIFSSLGLNQFIAETVLTIIGLIFSWAMMGLNSFLKAQAAATQNQAVILAEEAAAKARDTARVVMHQALTSGVRAAMVASPNATPTDWARSGIAYAYQSSGDKIKLLEPTAEVLIQIALSKVQEALGQKP